VYGYVVNNAVNWIDPLGLAWFRPDNHPYMVGRRGTLVEPGPYGIGRFIDDYVPAGHTFASLHDRFVGAMIKTGYPDWLVNIPSMPIIYDYAILQESLNSLFGLFGSNLFDHDLEDDFSEGITKCPN
jgi:hypothetical protein